MPIRFAASTGVVTNEHSIDWIAVGSVRDVPIGGHTEPVSPLALLWPWLLLAVMVATGAVVAVLALKRRTA